MLTSGKFYLVMQHAFQTNRKLLLRSYNTDNTVGYVTSSVNGIQITGTAHANRSACAKLMPKAASH